MTEQAREWTNMHGERLRIEWDEQDRAVLYHSDFDDKPVLLDIRVVGYDLDKPDPRASDPRGVSTITSESIKREATGDIILSGEEQTWLLGELITKGLRND